MYFPGLSVTENLLLALQQHQGEQILASFLQTQPIKTLEREATQKAMDLLEIGGLFRLKDNFAGNLSYGQQKILAFLSALMPDPDIILLDEPAEGLILMLIKEFTRIILDLNQQGLTFLVVEHNMDMIMNLCRRIVVLNHGVRIADGTPDEIRDNPEVLEAYFGG